MNDVKPGWRTSEFLLSLVALVLSALLASDVLGESSSMMKALVFLSAMLQSLGYTVSRGLLKRGVKPADEE